MCEFVMDGVKPPTDKSPERRGAIGNLVSTHTRQEERSSEDENPEGKGPCGAGLVGAELACRRVGAWRLA